MKKASLATSKLENTVSALLSARTQQETILFIILFVMILSLTPLLVIWGLSAGLAPVIGLLVAPLLAAALVRWPLLGFYSVAICSFAIEEDTLPVPVGTSGLYVFHWPLQLEGFIERPFGLLLLAVLFIWIFRRLVKRQPSLRGGALIWPFVLFMLCVLGGMVYGLAHGGDLKTAVVEFRPFWYLLLSYILAYNFVTRKSHIRGLFWLIIISAGLKGLQGLYVYLIAYHGNLTGHDTVMAHEESYFYAGLLLLLVIFCLHYRYRAQLIACLCVAPPVLISLVANQRRTDYIALLVGIAFAWVMIFVIKPKARRALLRLMIICVSLGIAYMVVFINVPGTLGSPARSVIGVFIPSLGDSRDALSNLYRDYENADLKYTAKQNPLGLGFGRAFSQPQSLPSVFPEIFSQDQYYNFVPHNNIYWIWVDLGAIGFFFLWYLFGSIIARGCFIARQLKDPYLQLVAIYIVAMTVMEIIVAYADYQLFFYRNVVDLGLLAGLLVKLPILDKEEEENLGGASGIMSGVDPALSQKENFTNESIHGGSVLSKPFVRGMHA